MKGKNRRSKFAQNRIEYIAYANPKGVSELVHDYGYEAPKSPHDLVKAAKILVRKNGRKAIKDLIKIHPDRKAILRVQRGKEDNYCGACSSFSYQPADNFCGVCGHSHYDGNGNQKGFLDQLVDLSAKELEEYYESTVRKSNDNPEDSNLSEEVQMVWNELRKRKGEDTDQPEKVEKESKKHGCCNNGLVILGLVFAAGVLIGSSLKTT